MIKCDFCQFSKPNDEGKLVCGRTFANGAFCEDAVKRFTDVQRAAATKPIEETKSDVLDRLFGKN